MRADASVLLAQHDARVATALASYLTDHGYQTRTTPTGDGALKTLAQMAATPPTLLVADAQLPGLDGIALLRRVRADHRFCGLPVVLLSSRGLAVDRIEGYRAGASAYILKPFDPAELLAIVDSLHTNAMLARASSTTEEVRALAAEVASTRQLLQLLVQVQLGGAAADTLGQQALEMSPDLADGLRRAGGSLPPALLQPSQPGSALVPVGQPGLPEPPRLTNRERAILDLVTEGMLNKEIAAQLGVSKSHVEKYVKRLLDKLGASNRTELFRRALELGLLQVEVPVRALGYGAAPSKGDVAAARAASPPPPKPRERGLRGSRAG